jgi:hypothetical protein
MASLGGAVSQPASMCSRRARLSPRQRARRPRSAGSVRCAEQTSAEAADQSASQRSIWGGIPAGTMDRSLAWRAADHIASGTVATTQLAPLERRIATTNEIAASTPAKPAAAPIQR